VQKLSIFAFIFWDDADGHVQYISISPPAVVDLELFFRIILPIHNNNFDSSHVIFGSSVLTIHNFYEALCKTNKYFSISGDFMIFNCEFYDLHECNYL
jgi:hypothetical protein